MEKDVLQETSPSTSDLSPEELAEFTSIRTKLEEIWEQLDMPDEDVVAFLRYVLLHPRLSSCA